MTSLVTGLGVGALTALVAVPMTAYAAWVRRYERRDALRKWRKGLRFGVLVVWLLVPFPLVAGGVGVAVREATADLAGVSASHLLAYLAETTALVGGSVLAGVVVYALYAIPAREYRNLDHGLGRTVTRASAGMAVAALFAVPPLTALVVPWLGAGAVVGAFVPVVVAWFFAWPTLRDLVQSVRTPTAAERERLDPALEAADFAPHAVRVGDFAPEEKLTVQLTGPSWRRSFLVSNYVLATIDDEALEAIVALNAAADRLRFPERGIALLAGTVGATSVAFFAFEWPWAFLAVLAVLAGFFVVKSRQRRLVFRMDEVAADLVGAETVLAGFRWRIETHGAPLDHSRVRTVLTGAPTRRERMRRLTADLPAEPADLVGTGDDATGTADPDRGGPDAETAGDAADRAPAGSEVGTGEPDTDDPTAAAEETTTRQGDPPATEDDADDGDADDTTDVDAWGVTDPADDGDATDPAD